VNDRVPEQPAVAPQRRERRQDRHLTLVQLLEPTDEWHGVWELRDGFEVLGYLTGRAEAADLIREALKVETPSEPSASEPFVIVDDGLRRALEQSGYDPVREERIDRELAVASQERGDARRAGFQTALADEWHEIYERALAAGVPLRGESRTEEARAG
jgi:hypothetical protein